MSAKRPKLEFHPEAFSEVVVAEARYAEKSSGVAKRFRAEVVASVRVMLQFPSTFRVFDGEARRLLVRTFPFQIVYRELSDCVQVIAVAHHRQKPGYWKHRVDNE